MNLNFSSKILLFAFTLIANTLAAQTSDDPRLCWYEPKGATQDDEITVYYNATRGNAELKGYTGDVYCHIGVLTLESTSPADWKHSSGWCDNDAKYKLTRSASDPDIYTLRLTPKSYFDMNDGEKATALVFVMRNSDASKTGRNADKSDIIVPLSRDNSTLGKYISHSYDAEALTVKAENGTLIITPYNKYVFKVFTQAKEDNTGERTSITVSARPDCGFSIEEDNDCLYIKTGEATVRMSKDNCGLAFLDKDGNVRLEENGGLDNSSVPRRALFAGMGDVAFYGAGYNGQATNLEGRSLVMNNTQTGGWDNKWSAPHNICVPFTVSTSGYGILFDDHYRNATLQPSAAGTSYQSGSLNPISYYYIGGDGTMESVLENYTFLTGRQELPPYWALGYITSRYGYRTRQEAEGVISSIKAAGLPIDAIVFDLYWQGAENSGMGNLDWYKANWNNPQEMLSNFNQQGVKTICITEPFFTSNTVNYEPLRQKGYFADEDVADMGWLGANKVGLIDATNPEAMDWMWQFYKARTEEGVGGWWLDLGEPERHDGDSHHKGGTVEQVHNEFGNLWIERVYRGLKEDFPNVRPFLMPRAGTSGMQRYSVFPWTGDIKRSWAGLQAQVPALVSAGMSGIGYMGSDVGGFSVENNYTDPSLYLRWIEMAVFSPMMRTHSTYLPEPYNDCYASVLSDVRDYINMRYSYLPYTYTLAYENATKGTPLARPVNFYDTDNSTLCNSIDEYLWGRDILVAPVLDNSSSREITFPSGKWVDLNDLTKTYNGGTTTDYSAPLETLPHFGRKGSFIARFSQPTFTNTNGIDNSRLSVTYLMDDNNQTVTSMFFDDDHQSTTSLTDGAYIITRFEGSGSASGHTISVTNEGQGYAGMPSSRVYTFTVPGYTNNINHVEQNVAAQTSSLAKVSSKAEFDAADKGVYYLSPDNTLYLKAEVRSDDRQTSLLIASSATGIEDISNNNSALTLEYSPATSLFSYAIPGSWSDGTLSIYNVSGTQTAHFTGLTADGTIHQVDSTDGLSKGIYIANISATDTKGARAERNIKIVIQ